MFVFQMSEVGSRKSLSKWRVRSFRYMLMGSEKYENNIYEGCPEK
jgi:hypothetical protein